MNYRRRTFQVLIALYACALLGSLAMVVGPFLNDREISKNPGRALARVTSVSATKTTVDYQDESGLFHSPPAGLLYPSGLGEGQRVWVAYSKTNPDLVKVENRSWTLAIVPALSVAIISTAIAGLLLLLHRWMFNSYARRKQELRSLIT